MTTHSKLMELSVENKNLELLQQGLNVELESLKKTLEETVTERNSIEDRSKNLIAEHKLTMDATTCELNRIGVTMEEVRIALGKKEEDLRVLVEHVDQLKLQIAHLESQLLGKEAELLTLQENLESISKEKETLLESLDRILADVKASETAVAMLNEQNTHLQNTVGRLSAEDLQLTADRDRLQMAIASIFEQCEGYRSSLDEAKCQAELANSKYQDVQRSLRSSLETLLVENEALKSDIENQKTALEKSTALCEELSVVLQSNVEQKFQLEQCCGEMKESCTRLEGEIAEVSGGNAKLVSEIQSITESLNMMTTEKLLLEDKSQAMIGECQLEIESLHAENDHFKQNLNEAAADLEMKQQNFDGIAAAAENLKCQIEHLEETCRSRESAIQRLEEHNGFIEKDKQMLMETVERQEADIRMATTEIDKLTEANSHFRDANNGLMAEVSQANKELTTLRAEMDTLGEECENLKSLLKDAEVERDENDLKTQSTISNLHYTVEALQLEKNILNGDLDREREIAATLNSTIEELTCTLRQTAEQTQQLIQLRDQLNTTIAQMEADLASSSVTNLSLSTETESIRDALCAAVIERKVVEERSQNLINEHLNALNSFKCERDQLRVELEEATFKIENNQEDLEGTMEQFDKLKERTDQLEVICKEKEGAIEKLQESLRAIENQKYSLLEVLERTTSNLKACDDLRTSLTESNGCLQNTNDRLSEELRQLSDERVALKIEVNRFSEQCESLRILLEKTELQEQEITSKYQDIEASLRASVEKLQLQNDALSSDLEKARIGMNKLTMDCESLTTSLQQNEEQRGQLEQCCHEVSTANTVLQSEIATSALANATLSSKLATLQELLDVTLVERKTFEEKSRNIIEEHSRDLTVIRCENDGLKKELDESSVRIKKKQEELEKLSEEVDEKSSQIAQLEEICTKSDSTILKLEEMHSMILKEKADLVEAMEKLSADMNVAKSDSYALLQKTHCLENSFETQSQEFLQVTTVKDSLAADLATLSEECENLRSSLQKSKYEKEISLEKQKDLESYYRSITEKATSESDELKSELINERKALEELTNKNESLMQTILQTTEQKQQLEQLCFELKVTVTKLQSDIDLHNSTNLILASENETLKDSLNTTVADRMLTEDKFQNAFKEHRTEMDAIKCEKHRLKNELEEATFKIDNNQEDFDRLMEQFEAMEVRADHLERACKDKEAALKKLQECLSTMEQEKSSLLDAVEKMSSNLEKSEANITTIMNERACLQNKVEKLTEEVAHFSIERISLQADIVRVSECCDKMSKSAEESESKKLESESKFKDLDESLRDSLDRLQNENRSIREELDHQQLLLKKLTNDNEHVSNNLQQNMEQKHQLEQSVEKMTETIGSLQHEIEKLSASCNTLAAEKNSVSTLLDSALAENRAIEIKLHNLIADNHQAVESLKSESYHLRKELEEVACQVDTKEENLKITMKDADDLRSRIVQLEEMGASKESDVKNFERDLWALQEEKSTLLETLEKLTSEVNLAKEESVVLTETNINLQNTIRRLSEEAIQNNGQQESLQAEMTSMSELCNSLRSSLRDIENEREVGNLKQTDLQMRLQSSLEELMHENEMLKTDLAADRMAMEKLSADRECLTSDLQKNIEHQQQLEQFIAELQQVIGKFQANAELQSASNSSLASEVESLKESLIEAVAEKTISDEKCKNLVDENKRELEFVRTAWDHLRKDLEEAEVKINGLQQEAESALQETDEVKLMMSHLEGVCDLKESALQNVLVNLKAVESEKSIMLEKMEKMASNLEQSNLNTSTVLDQNSYLKCTVEKLSDQIRQLEKEQVSQQSEIASVSTELQNAKSALQAAECKNEDIITKTADVELSLRSTIEKLQMDNQTTHKELTSLNQTLEQLHVDHESATKNLHQNAEQQQQLEQMCNDMKKTIEKIQRDVEIANASKESLASNFELLQQSLNETVMEKKTTEDKFLQLSADIKRERDALKRERDDLTEEIAEIRIELEKSLQNAEAKMSAMEQMRYQIMDLEQICVQKESAIHCLQEKVETIGNEKTTVLELLDRMGIDVKTSESCISILTEKNNILQVTIDRQMAEIAGIRQENTLFQERLLQKEHNIGELEEKLRFKESENSNLLQKMNRLAAEMEEFASRCTSLVEKSSQLQSHVDELTAEISELEEQHENLQAKTSQVSDQCELLASSLQASEDKNRELIANRSDATLGLMINLENLQAQNQDLIDKLELKSSQIDKLHEGKQILADAHEHERILHEQLQLEKDALAVDLGIERSTVKNLQMEKQMLEEDLEHEKTTVGKLHSETQSLLVDRQYEDSTMEKLKLEIGILTEVLQSERVATELILSKKQYAEDKMKEEFDCLTEKNVHLLGQVSELTSKISELVECRETLEEKRNQVAQQCDSLKTSSREAEVRYKMHISEQDDAKLSLQLSLESLEREKQDLTADLYLKIMEVERSLEEKRIVVDALEFERHSTKQLMLEKNALAAELKIETVLVKNLQTENQNLVDNFEQEKNIKNKALFEKQNLLTDRQYENAMVDRLKIENQSLVENLKCEREMYEKLLSEKQEVIDDLRHSSDSLLETNASLLNRIDEMTTEISEIVEVRRSLEEKIISNSEQCELLMTSLETAEEKHKEQMSKQNDSNYILENIVREKQHLAGELKLKIAVVDKLQEEKRALEDALECERTSMEQVQAERKALAENVEIERTTVESLQHNNQSLSDNITSVSNSLTEKNLNLQTRIEQLLSEISEVTALCESLKFELNQVSEDCKTLRSSLEAAERNYEESLCKESNSTSNLQLIRDKLNVENQNLKDDLESERIALEDLMAKYQNLTKNIEHEKSSYEKQLFENQILMDDLQKASNSLTDKNSELQRRVDEMTAEISESLDVRDSLRNQFFVASQQCEIVMFNLEVSEEKNKELLAFQNNAKSELDDLKAERQNLASELELKIDTVDKLREEIRSLEDELECEKLSVKRLELEKNTLAADIESKNNVLEDLQSEKLALTEDFENEQTARCKLESEYSDLQIDHQLVRSESEKLKMDLELLTGNLLQERDAVEKLLSEKKILEDKLKEVSGALADKSSHLKCRVEELTVEIHEMVEKRDSLQNEIVQVTNQREMLMNSMQAAEHKYEELLSTHNDSTLNLNLDIERLKIEKLDLINELDSKRATVEDLMVKNQALADQVRRETATSESLQLEIDTMTNNLQQERTSSVVQNSESQALIDNLQAVSDLLTEKNSQLQNEIDKLKSEISELVQVRESLQNEIAVITNQYKVLKLSLQASEEKYNEHCSKCCKELHTLECSLEKLKMDNHALVNASEAERTDVENLQKERAALLEQNKNLKSSSNALLAKATEELTSAKKKAEQLKVELMIAQNELQDKEQNESSMGNDLKEIGETVRTLEKNLLDSEKRNNTAKQTVKDLEQQLVQNQEALNEATGNASHLENEVDHLKKRLFDSEEENKAEKQKTKHAEDELIQSKSALSEAIAYMEKEVPELRKSLSESEEEKEVGKRKVIELEDRLTRNESVLRQATGNVARLEEEVRQLTKNLLDSEKENSAEKQTVKDLENEVGRLQVLKEDLESESRTAASDKKHLENRLTDLQSRYGKLLASVEVQQPADLETKKENNMVGNRCIITIYIL